MLLLLLLLVTALMIFIASITLVLEYPQNAQAFPCIGAHVKEYCIGYHDGAIQAHKDFNTGQDLDVDRHPCIHNTTIYCHGYNRGYDDETDFLG